MVRKLSNGEADMLDGWGNPIQVAIQEDPNGNPKAMATAEHNGVSYSSWDH